MKNMISRRNFLAAAGVVAAAGVLTACGGSSSTAASTAAASGSTAAAASGDTIKVSVKVTNTGDVAGTDVVQLYYAAPYTQFDVDNKIEKPTANLIAFGKTAEIEPGKSDTVELSFTKEDMASYCYTCLLYTSPSPRD